MKNTLRQWKTKDIFKSRKINHRSVESIIKVRKYQTKKALLGSSLPVRVHHSVFDKISSSINFSQVTSIGSLSLLTLQIKFYLKLD